VTVEALRCDVRSRFPVSEMVVSGPLSTVTAPTVRTTALKCLIDEPAALVLDLSGLVIVDDLALRAFNVLGRSGGGWPGCPVVLVIPSMEVRSAVVRLAVDRSVELCDTAAEAGRLVEQYPMPRRLTTQLSPTPEAGRDARRMFADGCRRWGVEHLIEDGAVVVTELVANAVEHAGTTIDFTMSLRDRYLHVTVCDGASTTPQRAGVLEEYAPGGRGLLLVEAYAAAWGHATTTNGKVVWATLRATNTTG
jgi:anti-sigma regulatory factor (Ser/Thr protein kinase)/anti-anti-sigma regulatory factor